MRDREVEAGSWDEEGGGRMECISSATVNVNVNFNFNLMTKV